MQTSLEGQIEVEVNGKTVRVDLAGDYRKAAGAEVLLFGPDKHDEGPGVLAQLIQLGVAWSFWGGETTGVALAVAAAAVVVLVCVFLPASLHALEPADDDTPDQPSR